jgi:hypothetical protein
MKSFLWIATTVLWLGVALVSLVGVLFLPMLFDAPGSEDSRKLQATALCILATPILCLMAATMPWILKRKRHAGWLFLLPLLSLSPIVLLDQL